MIFSIILKSQLEGTKRLDAEYYQPEFLNLVNNLYSTRLHKSWGDISGKFITGPFGSAFNTEGYIKNGEYRYVRGKDVKEFFLQDEDNVYIPQNDFERLKKYALQEGDVLVSVVGTLGNAAVVGASVLPAIYSCKSTVFRSKEIDPYFLVTYLNCKYGSNLLMRSIRGAIQTGLNIDDLTSLSIYVPGKDEQKTINKIVQGAKDLFDKSKMLYSECERILVEGAGLSILTNHNAQFSVVNYSQIKNAKRIDPEYFNSPCNKMLLALAKGQTAKLGDLVDMTKGVEPGAEAYQDKGKLFIRVSSISKDGLIDKTQKFISEELYDEYKNNYQPQVGEILLTKDASPGMACVIREPVEGIISSGVMRLKLKDKINTEYLTLVLNSVVGRLQAERDAGGSIIAHWKPEQIKNLIVPILPISTQNKIAGLLLQSHQARKKATELLEEAKLKVEEIIEKGGDKV